MKDELPDVGAALGTVLKSLRGGASMAQGKKAAKGKAKATKGAAPRKAKKVVEMHPCGCGCKTPVARRFAPGHDARLKGQLLRVAREIDKGDVAAAKARLKSEGWLHFLSK